jgi:formamidopyrimidine-DNA glycosylase
VEDEEEESDAAEEPKLKKRKTAANGTAKQTKTRAKEEVKSEDTTGKRRSGRLSK